MRYAWCYVALTAFLIAAILLGVGAATAAIDKPPAKNRAVAIKFRDALETPKKNDDARLAALRDALRDCQKSMKNNVVVIELLQKPIGNDASEQLNALTRQARDVLEVLEFQPTMEAKLPEGFPKSSPVGEITVKKYPEYRFARTPVRGTSDAAFWTLFKHIEKNEIAMTAPVEIAYAGQDGQDMQAQSMAFLYSSTSQGSTGPSGDVDVVDVPAQTTVSIGMSGDLTDKAVERARAHLLDWLTEHKHKYKPAGPLRVMGYNSPFIPIEQRYFEVEFPIQPIDKTAKPTPGKPGTR
jgi:hypothetical protein